jgi:hypothetical protein
MVVDHIYGQTNKIMTKLGCFAQKKCFSTYEKFVVTSLYWYRELHTGLTKITANVHSARVTTKKGKRRGENQQYLKNLNKFLQGWPKCSCPSPGLGAH